MLGATVPIEVGPFAAAVYEIVSGEAPAEIDAFDARAEPATDLAVWPAAEPVALAAEPCAVLDADEGRASRTQLATSPTGEASALEVGDAIRYSVAPGQGAYVRTAGHGDVSGGQQWVVDSGGTRYRLGGKGVETAEQARVRRLRRADHPRRVDRAVRLRPGAVHAGGDVRARRGGGDRLVRAVRSLPLARRPDGRAGRRARGRAGAAGRAFRGAPARGGERLRA